MFKLSARSEANLVGVHPDLVRVVRRAIEITDIDFMVGEGVRTLERQKQLYAQGKSKTLNSRHIPGKDGYGKAVDLWVLKNGQVTWETKYYVQLAKHVLKAAKELGVDIRWGGDWNQNGDWRDEKFFDGPHFELSTRRYP
jgi:D-alanyl-D-alanine carboxypeptidase.